MPTRRFIAIAALITSVGIAAFIHRMRQPDQGSTAVSTAPSVIPAHDPATSASGRESTKPLTDRRPETGEFIPSPTRCPRFTPRSVAVNGRDWRVYADKEHCLSFEYPKDWHVTASAHRISIGEPTGHGRDEYFETSYIGEMTGVVHVALSTAVAWAPEPHGYARRDAIIYAKDIERYYSSVAAYRMFLPDRTIVDIDGYAPPKDAARIGTVKKILRSVETHNDGATTSLDPYVN